jgi:hypothetical protein
MRPQLQGRNRRLCMKRTMKEARSSPQSADEVRLSYRLRFGCPAHAPLRQPRSFGEALKRMHIAGEHSSSPGGLQTWPGGRRFSCIHRISALDSCRPARRCKRVSPYSQDSKPMHASETAEKTSSPACIRLHCISRAKWPGTEVQPVATAAPSCSDSWSKLGKPAPHRNQLAATAEEKRIHYLLVTLVLRLRII